jgi:ABC-type sugar transport system, periplasmic component
LHACRSTLEDPHTYALFWNKDLFEDAGLDPDKPPETIEELTEMADKLTIVEADGTVTQLGFIPNFSWSHLNLYARMFGGYWYSDDGTKVTLTSEGVINALKWEQQFYSKYGADQVLKFTSAMGGYMSPDQGFYAGKLAMMVDGEWQTGPNFISKFKPELNYGVAPFPYPKDHPERKNTNVLEGSVVMIPAGVADKEAAGKLLAWMVSPEIIAEEMIANYNLPTSKKAAEDPRFHESEKFEVFLALMADPNATTGIYTPINSEVYTAYQQIEEQVLNAGADPLPLAQEAEATLQAQLDEVLGK